MRSTDALLSLDEINSINQALEYYELAYLSPQEFISKIHSLYFDGESPRISGNLAILLCKYLVSFHRGKVEAKCEVLPSLTVGILYILAKNFRTLPEMARGLGTYPQAITFMYNRNLHLSIKQFKENYISRVEINDLSKIDRKIGVEYGSPDNFLKMHIFELQNHRREQYADELEIIKNGIATLTEQNKPITVDELSAHIQRPADEVTTCLCATSSFIPSTANDEISYLQKKYLEEHRLQRLSESNAQKENIIAKYNRIFEENAFNPQNVLILMHVLYFEPESLPEELRPNDIPLPISDELVLTLFKYCSERWGRAFTKSFNNYMSYGFLIIFANNYNTFVEISDLLKIGEKYISNWYKYFETNLKNIKRETETLSREALKLKPNLKTTINGEILNVSSMITVLTQTKRLLENPAVDAIDDNPPKIRRIPSNLSLFSEFASTVPPSSDELQHVFDRDEEEIVAPQVTIDNEFLAEYESDPLNFEF